MLHFNVLDSCVVPFAEESEELSKTTLAQFFENKSTRPRLVYVGERSATEQSIRLHATNAGLQVEISPKQAAEYRNLQKGVVYLMKQDQLRGIDFRAQDGISLLVAAPVAHMRALDQLCGRVGRYREPCSRFLADHLPNPVCPVLSNRHTQAIVRRIEQL